MNLIKQVKLTEVNDFLTGINMFRGLFIFVYSKESRALLSLFVLITERGVNKNIIFLSLCHNVCTLASFSLG